MDDEGLVCEGCGCTDESACIDMVLGAPCVWIIRSEDGRRALCSVCAKVRDAVSLVLEGILRSDAVVPFVVLSGTGAVTR